MALLRYYCTMQLCSMLAHETCELTYTATVNRYDYDNQDCPYLHTRVSLLETQYSLVQTNLPK